MDIWPPLLSLSYLSPPFIILPFRFHSFSSILPLLSSSFNTKRSCSYATRLEVLADVSASMQSGMSGNGPCGGAVGGVGGGGEILASGNLKGAVGGVSTSGGGSGKRARLVGTS